MMFQTIRSHVFLLPFLTMHIDREYSRWIHPFPRKFWLSRFVNGLEFICGSSSFSSFFVVVDHAHTSFFVGFFFFLSFGVHYTLHIMCLNGSNVSISRNFDVFSLLFVGGCLPLFFLPGRFFSLSLFSIRLTDHISFFIRSIWQRLDNSQSQKILWRIHLVSERNIERWGELFGLF